jgi:hypothetical protein
VKIQIMVLEKGSAKKKKQHEAEIPASLIFETIDGRPFYRKGYLEVLNNNKTIEEIMAISSLQGVIISYLLEILFTRVGTKQYRILSNEIGVHIEHNNNLASDIGIFDKNVLTPAKINIHLPDVPARIFIEVDIRAETDDLGETGYISLKTQKLLDFGAEKVIWVLTKPKMVIMATPGGKWDWLDWNLEIELMDGIEFNIGKYLDREGVE